MSIKISISLSRKVSKDFNSDCVVVGLEHDIQASLDRHGDLLEEISRSFQLCERAVAEEFQALHGPAPERHPELQPTPAPPENGPPLATERQKQFIQTLFKRSKMSQKSIREHITSILGSFIALDELTKKQAAQLIESLTTAEKD